jgi:nucleotide-binding universal stress UspA family protein
VNIPPAPLTKTILCTIDFSKSTEHSIKWGVTIAQQLNAHLTILYNYRLIQSSGGEIFHLKKNIEEEAMQKFSHIEKNYLAETGIGYDFRIEVGFVSDRIEDHAKRNTFNFLVLDKNVNTNSNETLEELLEHIHVPMLVVP